MRFLFFMIFTAFGGCVGKCSEASPYTRGKEPITLLTVEKGKRQLHAYGKKGLIKTYKIALGFSPVGHKKKQGDGKTPIGKYTISAKNPHSLFHRSLRVSYPSREDRQRSITQGISDPGGDIMVHGLGKKRAWQKEKHCKKDWTHGCIAVTNEEIEEIYEAVDKGCMIDIRG